MLYQNYERQKAEERGMEEGIVKIIRIPLLKGHSVDQVCEFLDQPRERVEKIYNQLVQEGLIHPNT